MVGVGDVVLASASIIPSSAIAIVVASKSTSARHRAVRLSPGARLLSSLHQQAHPPHIVLLAYQTLGDPGVVECDESKVTPRGGDEDILDAAELLKVSSELLLGEGRVLIADIHFFLPTLAAVGLPGVRNLEGAVPSIDDVLLPPHCCLQALFVEPDESIACLLVFALLHLTQSQFCALLCEILPDLRNVKNQDGTLVPGMGSQPVVQWWLEACLRG